MYFLPPIDHTIKVFYQGFNGFEEISFLFKCFHFSNLCIYEFIYDLVIYVTLILFSTNVLPDFIILVC